MLSSVDERKSDFIHRFGEVDTHGTSVTDMLTIVETNDLIGEITGECIARSCEGVAFFRVAILRVIKNCMPKR